MAALSNLKISGSSSISDGIALLLEGKRGNFRFENSQSEAQVAL